MPRAKVKPDPIPESFASIEEAAEWWDSHSTADYWDESREVKFDIQLPPRKPTVALDSDVAERLRALASEQGVSLETLVNRWLQEKLRETVPVA